MRAIDADDMLIRLRSMLDQFVPSDPTRHMRPYDALRSWGLQQAIVMTQNAETIQPEPHWIPVKERLPENEVNVLITVEHRPIGRKSYRRVVRAFHEDGTWSDIRSAYSWDDDSWDDYVDEDGNFLIPEGWFEAIDYHGEFCAVDDFVIAWMPLPEAFKGVNT